MTPEVTLRAADATAAFVYAMRQRGLIPPNDLIADGRPHRCRVEGARPSKRDGTYLLHLDERAAGGFQNWKDGQPWQDWRYSNGATAWTAAERAEFDAKVAVRKKAEEEKRLRLAAAAQREAIERWNGAHAAHPNHPYLRAKQVGTHGLRQAGNELLVPRFDVITGEMVSLQRILPDGEKRNLTGARVDGTWHIIGKLGSTILVSEGWASGATGYEITGNAAVVTFGTGKLEACAVELRKQQPNARIILLADDDWKEPRNPGLTAAMSAAKAAKADMAVPQFGGSDRADKDTDFNDMHRLAGADAVKNAIESAKQPCGARREPPRPLTRLVDPATEYPVDALGPELAAAARAIEARTQAPMAMCAQAVLGAAALAAQAHRDVEMPGGLQRPLSLALLTLAPSGERKTTVDALALRTVREVERNLQQQYALDLASYKNDQAAWDQVRKPSGKNTKDKTAVLADLMAAGEEPTTPRKPIILVSEPTPEGLVKLLAEGQPSAGLFSAEASTFIGGHGMTAESRLRTAGVLSRLWDDGSADRSRASDGTLKLFGKRLTISLATQPGNGLEWLASPVLADQGLFSRLLIVAPTSRIGSRLVTPETNDGVRQTQGDLDRYHARIGELLDAAPKISELTPAPMRLSPIAHELWVDFANAIEIAMGGGGSLAAVRAFANKAGEHALRLAGVLTVYRDREAALIDDETVLHATVLVQHYLGEATRINGLAAASEGSRRAQETLDFLNKLDRSIVCLTEIYQRGPSSVRNAATARAVMQMLTDHGYVEPIPDGAEIDGVHRQEAWRVLPTDDGAER